MISADTAARLKAVDDRIAAMERRHDCARDDLGMLPRHHREIAESIEEEEQRRRRVALAYLWMGDEQADHSKHRRYGVDDFLEPYPLPRPAWLVPAVVLFRRLRVSWAIVRGRWGIEWRQDDTGPEQLRSWNAEDVCFFENSHWGGGYSVLVLRYHTAQDRVDVSSDGESFM